MRRPILYILAGGALLIIGILTYGLIYAVTPPAGQVSSKTVTLEKGLAFRQIALTLERESVITGAMQFVLLGRLLNAGHQVKAGEYCFDLPMSPWQVLRKITRGHVKTYRITIPEGYTLVQIANLLDSHGIVAKEDFLRETSSPELLSRYQIEVQGSSLEGYLFPDTYAWSKGSDPSAVIQFFLRRFREVYTPEMAQKTRSLGLSEREALTIASIVERETSDPRERPLVSAVVHNRLKKKIRLQSDPTVIYGIPDFNGNLTREDLRRYTRYNTYLIPGLPPGPICNPGLSSIQAALSPAPVDYLYFVSKNDGTHHFSVTLEEHDKAVDKYQRRSKR
jgi:UPF0755 protein